MSLFDRLVEAGGPTPPPTPGQLSWDEKKHPRVKGGKFQKKFKPSEPTPPAPAPTPSNFAKHFPASSAEGPRDIEGELELAAAHDPPEAATSAPPPALAPTMSPATTAPLAPTTVPPMLAALTAPAVVPAATPPAPGAKKPRVPSKYQQAVFDWITAKTKQPSGALVVAALAGAGKTATIEDSLVLLPKNQEVVFLAYNKHIAVELQRRTAGNKNVIPATISSLGWAACRKAYPGPDGKGPKLDEKKISKIIDAVVKNKDERRKWGKDIENLIRFKKQYYAVDEHGKFSGLSVLEIAAKHHIEIPAGDEGQRFLAAALDVWNRGNKDTDTMDWGDQIFVPAARKLPLASPRPTDNLRSLKADWLFVDEAQDLSMTERTLVGRVAPRSVYVGDVNQSIQGFKGADPTSMAKIKQNTSADELPLSICYRCPKAVIAEAQKIVPSMEAAPDAEEGLVDRIPHNAVGAHAQPGDWVICRNTAPLVVECLRMIGQGKKAIVKGKDIGAKVGELLEKVNKKIGGDDVPADVFFKALHEHLDHEVKRLNASGKEAMATALGERVDTLHALGAGCKTVGEIKKNLNKVFSDDDTPGVTFSTVHRSKGLEADHVFIMRPDLMPFPFAKTPEEMEQEMNLKYVAITRAKKHLTWVDPPPKKKGGGMFAFGESVEARRSTSLFDAMVSLGLG